MAPRVVPPPKKNKARCGIKYPLRIYKGDMGADSEYLDEDPENQSVLAVADVDINEGNEQHLQSALATKAEIPTPGTVSIVDNYEQLYPGTKWTDPITYVCTSTTVEESISNALADDCTYYMDERDEEWLDKNNQEARGEGTSAQGARATRQAKDKEPEIGVPVSISEDEFELVMGLLEKLANQQILPDDKLDFSLYQHFFTKSLPADAFASCTTPSWIPPSALLIRIARTIYPHWKHRRSLLDGRRIRPLLNFDECDFPNESYICFRRRDNKPVRKTRAGQSANNADKLTSLQKNLTQALALANALLNRETVKQTVTMQSQNVWRLRQPLADMLRRFPAMLSKADEDRLFERPRKKPPRTSLKVKVKVNPPGQPGSPGPAPPNPAMMPSERFASIQRKIADTMEARAPSENQEDVVDDPYQQPLLPRSEEMWVDVPPPSPTDAFVPDEEVMRGGFRAVRLRVGRGGRRLLDRRSNSHPYLAELRKQRQHADDDGPDEEATRRLQSQWRFDADHSFDPSEEEDPEPIEYDQRYQVGRLARLFKDDGKLYKEECTLVTDASLEVRQPSGGKARVLPFYGNALFVTGIHKSADQAITVAAPSSSPRARDVFRATPVAQRVPSPSSSPSHPHPRAPPPMRASPSPAQSRLQENIFPSPKPSSSNAHLAGRASPSSPLGPHAGRAPPSSPLGRASPSSPSSSLGPHSAARAMPRIHPALPHNPNPIITVSRADAAKVGGGQQSPVNVNANANPHAPAQHHRLQTNGARTAIPAYVPVAAGSNRSLKLPSRSPARPSPLTTHSVVAAPIGSPSRRSE
ncbi:enhancer of polycomb-like-domain-containing protein [Mycena metata]|uniref:Enhancer of polycomb-like protein n=1 Tax=Mycena metata TaxID=1033252 RepID=A0AAD7IN44_9AGAR|nr:enhancer of polycomb-like-domain-containing protein [Mycena metata]